MLSQDAYIQAINDLWQYIFKEWFPGSDYRHDDEKCNFEVYSGKVMQIYVPVCWKQPTHQDITMQRRTP